MRNAIWETGSYYSLTKQRAKKSERELLVRGEVIGSWSDNQFE